MSRAEEFIQEHTKKSTNEIGVIDATNSHHYYKWLTPNDARKAVEIAREEMLNGVYEWIEENIGEYCGGENIMFSAIHIENIDIFGQERFINDLKQVMKDE